MENSSQKHFWNCLALGKCLLGYSGDNVVVFNIQILYIVWLDHTNLVQLRVYCHKYCIVWPIQRKLVQSRIYDHTEDHNTLLS